MLLLTSLSKMYFDLVINDMVSSLRDFHAIMYPAIYSRNLLLVHDAFVDF